MDLRDLDQSNDIRILPDLQITIKVSLDFIMRILPGSISIVGCFFLLQFKLSLLFKASGTDAFDSCYEFPVFSWNILKSSETCTYFIL